MGSPSPSNKSSVIEVSARGTLLRDPFDEDMMNTDEGICDDDKLIPSYIETQCLTSLKVRYILGPEVQSLLKQSARFSTSFHNNRHKRRDNQPRESLLPCKLKPRAVHDETLAIESPERSRLDECNIEEDEGSDSGTLAHNVSNLNLFEVRDTMLEQMRFSNPD